MPDCTERFFSQYAWQPDSVKETDFGEDFGVFSVAGLFVETSSTPDMFSNRQYSQTACS